MLRLIAALYLSSISTAFRVQRDKESSDIQNDQSPRTQCPSFARHTNPDENGYCECKESEEVCFRKHKFAEKEVLQRGCGSNQSDVVSFPVGCTHCMCLPKAPKIERYGDYVTVSNADHLTVKRQGAIIHEFATTDAVINYSLAKYMHQEVVLVALAKGCVNGKTDASDSICARAGTGVTELPVFVKRSDLCGVGLFTTPQLTCSKLGTNGARVISAIVDREMTSRAIPAEINRGFGLELELVARKIPKPLLEKAKQDNRIKVFFQRQVFNGLSSLFSRISSDANKSARRGVDKLVQALGLNDFETFLERTGILNLPVLEECFINTTAEPQEIGSECTSNDDCALTQYCMDCGACSDEKAATTLGKAWDSMTSWMPWKEHLPNATLCRGCPSREAKVCQRRSECNAGLPVNEGVCPVPLQKWAWTSDPSVHPISKDDAEALLPAGDREHEGTGFELVSPPLSGKEGMKSAIEVMTVLKRMGIQAGVSSGMHVHVNVASPKVPGTILSPAQIANVWVAFAKYQLVIDEMLSPSRLGNHYARRIFLGKCSDEMSFLDELTMASCSDEHPCQCAKVFFKNIHRFVVDNPSNGTVDDFCNAALALPGNPFPCKSRYPDQRYYALNLIPLTRLGTVEFRAHSATYDVERMQRWTQFVIAFVEHFGVDAPSAGARFFDNSSEIDLKELADAQQTASSSELFGALRSKISTSTHEYFTSRPWEKGAPGCGTSAERRFLEKGSLEEFRRDSKVMQSLGDQIQVDTNWDE